MTNLYDSVEVGELRLKNRICMAPMARARNDIDRTPTLMMAEYYAQRATAGLITAGSLPADVAEHGLTEADLSPSRLR